MSLNVMEKLANGDKLTEDEVKWAHEHAIALPEEYGPAPLSVQAEIVRPSEPIFQGGAAFAPSPGQAGPGLFLTAEQLDSLDKGTLTELADAAGYEVSGRAKKADVVQALIGGVPSGEEESDADESDEGSTE